MGTAPSSYRLGRRGIGRYVLDALVGDLPGSKSHWIWWTWRNLGPSDVSTHLMSLLAISHPGWWHHFHWILGQIVGREPLVEMLENHWAIIRICCLLSKRRARQIKNTNMRSLLKAALGSWSWTSSWAEWASDSSDASEDGSCEWRITGPTLLYVGFLIRNLTQQWTTTAKCHLKNCFSTSTERHSCKQ